MSLLGIDVGATGCKAAVFSEVGRLIASAYEEYDMQRPQPGRAELDSQQVWEQVKAWAGLDRGKLPATAPSGTVIGTVSGQVADELGLPAQVAIVTGAHDQCASAVGCGVIHPGRAAYGLGDFICATPVFDRRPEPGVMIERGLNTEHHRFHEPVGRFPEVEEDEPPLYLLCTD